MFHLLQIVLFVCGRNIIFVFVTKKLMLGRMCVTFVKVIKNSSKFCGFFYSENHTTRRWYKV
jgi:hypothetical protein